MEEHLTNESLRTQGKNQFDLVLDLIGRAKVMIDAGRDQGWESTNIALQTIEDAVDGIEPETYIEEMRQQKEINAAKARKAEALAVIDEEQTTIEYNISA